MTDLNATLTEREARLRERLAFLKGAIQPSGRARTLEQLGLSLYRHEHVELLLRARSLYPVPGEPYEVLRVVHVKAHDGSSHAVCADRGQLFTRPSSRMQWRPLDFAGIKGLNPDLMRKLANLIESPTVTRVEEPAAAPSHGSSQSDDLVEAIAEFVAGNAIDDATEGAA